VQQVGATCGQRLVVSGAADVLDFVHCWGNASDSPSKRRSPWHSGLPGSTDTFACCCKTQQNTPVFVRRVGERVQTPLLKWSTPLQSLPMSYVI